MQISERERREPICHSHLHSALPWPHHHVELSDAEEQSANERLWYIVHAQIQEMELVRTKIYQLETTQIAMKSKYVLRL